MTLSVLVVTGGHPFEAPAFFEIFSANLDITWTESTIPRTGFDVVVFYDMPGITFTRTEPPVTFSMPSKDYRNTLQALQDQGTGLVFLHHAIASWPAWEEFATLIGGRFHYQPGILDGHRYPDSGYILDITHTVEVVAPDHPVCIGLEKTFPLHDELYCFPVLESQVLPLMRTTFPVQEARPFSSADTAIGGRIHRHTTWSHPPGSSLVAWAKTAGRSPLVYLQFGNGPSAYSDSNFRRILSQAIRWTASDEARQWARNWEPNWNETFPDKLGKL